MKRATLLFCALAMLLVGCNGIKLPPLCICPSPAPTTIPSPDPTVTPGPTPTPVPTPLPTPTPAPTPSPCIPQVVRFECPAGTPQCWQCSEYIEHQVARGNWTRLSGTTLVYNDRGNDQTKREYLDENCNYVRRDGSIIRTAEQQYGVACVDDQAICPPDRLTTCPSPTPSTPPGPSPTPGPTPAACPALGGIGAQVHQFQNRQHQTVPYTREGDGGTTYVANGPVIGGQLHTDSTPYFGGGGPNFRCNGEGRDACGGRQCEDVRGSVWTQIGGPRLGQPCHYNNGADGDCASRGYGYRGVIEHPGLYSFEVCTGGPWITPLGERVPGRACKVIHARVTQ